MPFSEWHQFLFETQRLWCFSGHRHISLPSCHSLAGNRTMTRDGFTAPFTVRMANQGKGCFPLEAKRTSFIYWNELKSLCGKGEGRPTGCWYCCTFDSLLSAFPFAWFSDYTGTPCAGSDLVTLQQPPQVLLTRHKTCLGVKSLLLQLQNTNHSGEYF